MVCVVLYRWAKSRASAALLEDQMGLPDSVTNLLDRVWLRAKTTAGLCAPSAATVETYLEKGEQYTERAYYVTEITNVDPSIAGKLKDAAESIGRIRKGVSKVKGTCLDVKAVGEIGDAVAILNVWVEQPNGGKVSTQEAAQAFDQLFHGTARFASKLPPPFNAYADVLETIGISGFFSGMEKKLNPESRWKRQFDEIDKN